MRVDVYAGREMCGLMGMCWLSGLIYLYKFIYLKQGQKMDSSLV